MRLEGPGLSVDLKAGPSSKLVELAHNEMDVIDQVIMATDIHLHLAEGRSRALVGHGSLPQVAQDCMQVGAAGSDGQGQSILHKGQVLLALQGTACLVSLTCPGH